MIDGYNVTNIIVSQIYGYNLYLKGRITLNAYLFIPQKELQDSGLYVTLNGVRYPVSEAATRVVDGRTLYTFSVEKNAKEYHDAETLRLYGSAGNLLTLYRQNEDVTETGWSYSVQTYLDRALEVSDDPYLKELVTAMNDYGSYAQQFFRYNLANRSPILGDSGSVTKADLEKYRSTVVYAKDADGNDRTGVTHSGSSLLLQSDTIIRHYFTIDEGSIDDYTFTARGQALTPTATTDGAYYVEITDVYAKHLDNDFALTVSDSKGTVMTLHYSALSYAYAAMEQSDQDLIDVVKALYRYNQKASAFFDKEG